MHHIDALDTMKATGMLLIVYGHVAHATTVSVAPPIYVKQFGVAFFLFASGYTLARERRSSGEAVIRRLAPVYGYGLGLALVLSVIGAATGTGLALSNYAPFAAGANVLLNHFPANPTTWYVGTYVHVLALWALWLRRITVRPWMIAAAVVAEIPVRASLIVAGLPYVAYMLITNWAAVFLLGSYCGECAIEPGERNLGTALAYAGLLVGALAAWSFAFRWLIGVVPTFPFMTITNAGAVTSAVLISTGTSLLYLGPTALTFAVARRFETVPLAGFIARNSLVIFLAHMPVFYVLGPRLSQLGLGYAARAGIEFVVCVFGLAAVSEALRAVVRRELVTRRFIMGITQS